MRRVSRLLLQAAGRAPWTASGGTPGSAAQAAVGAQAARASGGPKPSPRRGGRVLLQAPPKPPEEAAADAAATARRNAATFATLLAAAGGAYYVVRSAKPTVRPPEEATLVNWSGTHEVQVSRLYQPESVEELEAVVQRAHDSGQKLRCTGSGLSPNGISFCSEGMVSLALLDKVLEINREQRTVRVQAGVRVQQLADALRLHGLSLPNYASIKEQTIGGLTQVSAHGSGASLAPLDEYVEELVVVTPALGTLRLSRSRDPELFALARVGLGCLGVVAEATLRCVPAHRLAERTVVLTRAQVEKGHAQRLKAHRHVRYMWIPLADAVVVVTSDELPEGTPPPPDGRTHGDGEAATPMRQLLLSRLTSEADREEAAGLSWSQLRDRLVALAPLDKAWIQQVNRAEAEYWRRAAGSRVDWSDRILGFDCGGQQWVHEVALPAGTQDAPSGVELAYIQDLMSLIDAEGIPAPAPIEQRWTAGSSSPMSPAAGPPGLLFSWVGVIMYLPEDNPQQRQQVTDSFRRYARLVEERLAPRYNAAVHWAKVEVPRGQPAALAALQTRLAARFPVAEFNAARARVDPHNVLGNEATELLFPRGGPAGGGA